MHQGSKAQVFVEKDAILKPETCTRLSLAAMFEEKSSIRVSADTGM
jgi:hypothetical protein